MPAELPPVSFIRVFWASMMTMWNAPKELRQLLDNLRTELFGERTYFKNAIKQARSKSRKSTRDPPDIMPLSILSDSIKNMLIDFRTLEAPFLHGDEHTDDLDIEKSGKVSLRGDYGRMDIRRRLRWLHTKDDFIDIQNKVTRMQARRIAYETSNTLSCVRDVEKRVQDLDDRLYDLEEHFLVEEQDEKKVYVKRRYPSK